MSLNMAKIIFLSILLSSVAMAKQPLKVVVNIYNLTGVPHQIIGHQEQHYASSADIDVSHNAQEKMSHLAHKPSKISIQPWEKGHMYRMRYQVTSDTTACTLDFVIRWHSKEKQYELDNITSHGTDSSACPLSPVRKDSIGNQAVFSMAVIKYPDKSEPDKKLQPLGTENNSPA